MRPAARGGSRRRQPRAAAQGPAARLGSAALTTHGLGNHALRNERWRYIRYADGGEELYDHQNDPNEWTNLAGKPEFATVKTELAKWLPKTDAQPVPQGETPQERKAE